MLGKVVRGAFAALVALVVSMLSQPGGGSPRPAGPVGGTPFTVVQMNLCLSGLSGCFPRTRYPSVVAEAVREIRRNRAAAVTLAEACSGDVRHIAHVVGYTARFAAVDYGSGAPIRCRDPGGRGIFGIAVLTRSPVTASRTTQYDAQDGVEDRQALCVTTRQKLTVCGTHLTVRLAGSKRDNDAQCRQLTRILAHRQRGGPVLAAGDMNRSGPCAPPRMWTRSDTGAAQAAGLQHVYGTARFAAPVVRMDPMRFTDHDALVVTTRLRR